MTKRKFDCKRKRSIDFESPSQEDIVALEKAMAKYFEACDRENTDKIIKPYTLSGLLYSIRLSKEEFACLANGTASELADRAMLKIESFIEENALSGRIPSNAAMNSLKTSFSSEKEQTKHEAVSITLDNASAMLSE